MITLELRGEPEVWLTEDEQIRVTLDRNSGLVLSMSRETAAWLRREFGVYLHANPRSPDPRRFDAVSRDEA